MDVEPLPLFVYGTLRRGERNHHYLTGSYTRMQPAVLHGFGRLHPLMIVRRDAGTVQGELYTIRPDAWKKTIRGCDDLEGIPPGQDAGPDYRRMQVRVTTPAGEEVAWA